MVAALVFMNWILSLLSYHFISTEQLLSGKTETLYKNNKINWRLMRKHFITKDDLQRASRKVGLTELGKAKAIFIERNGEITVIPK